MKFRPWNFICRNSSMREGCGPGMALMGEEDRGLAPPAAPDERGAAPPRDPRYDILFEPVGIGPVTARNRFYQVPHCNGMGYRLPQSLAAMRRVKAEGGWAVVCTEEVEIHASTDVSPFSEGRLWDDSDMPRLALMADAVHAEGALAGIEIIHN